MKQFTTHCKYCGRLIVMTWNEPSKKWVPCDPEINRYRRCGSPFFYVDVNGFIRHGEKVGHGYPDSEAEFGYQRHRYECSNMIRRNAI